MKFKALPVRCGDSFLLECDGQVILVDGGKNKKDIVTILKEEIPNRHIDLLICTHYDSDHINGIVGILKSNKFSFKELWLPEIFGSIAYTFANSTNEILNFLSSRDHLEEVVNAHNIEINQQYQIESADDSFELIENDDSFELIDNEILSFLIENRYWHWHFHLNEDERLIKLITNLFKITTLINYSLNSGAYIRWFSYRNYITKGYYGYSIYPQNSVQTRITKYPPALFYHALYLTTINKESLVFLFDKENYPNVLFTADSDFSFCNRTISLMNNSIVTAPHHGSESNYMVYSKIVGSNLVFVRSDNSQIKRPGQTYIKLLNQKYCTICRNKTVKRKVELVFLNGQFITNVNTCTC